jgi:hypothetical protein
MKKRKKEYVNNRDFCDAIIEYKKRCSEADEQDEIHPVMPKYIGECILKIATKLSFKYNFINYPFREDMVNDGILNCLLYFHNFDPAKSTNPFAYYTQIIYFAFLRRITKEKKMLYTKIKKMEIAFVEGQLRGDKQFMEELNITDNMENFVRDFEEAVEKKKNESS